MKIEYLSLENFVNVYAGLKRKKVVLDFKKSRNKKILILGDNGSGKTVLLSSLQPYRETNDNREMAVLEGETRATKIIKIRDGKNLYEIKHYYGKSSSQNKSFIKKNDEELNEGGSIRNFLTILESELKITKDYFVLGRLGDNVSNFIDQGMSDRKKYINKFIPNIDRFLNAHQLVSERLNGLDRQIKTISVSLEKYGDLEENKVQREKLSERISQLEELKSKTTSDLAVLTDKLTRVQEQLSNYPEDLEGEITNLETEIKQNKEAILSPNVIKDEKDAFSIKYVNESLDKLHAKKESESSTLQDLLSKRRTLQTKAADTEAAIKKNLNTIEMMADDSQEALETRKAELIELKESLEKDIRELEALDELKPYLVFQKDKLRDFEQNIDSLWYSTSNHISSAPIGVTDSFKGNLQETTPLTNLKQEIESKTAKVTQLKEDYAHMKAEYDKVNRKSGLLEILDHSDHSDHAKDCPIVAMAIGFKDKALTINDIAAKVEELSTEIWNLEQEIKKGEDLLNSMYNFRERYLSIVNSHYSKSPALFESFDLGPESEIIYQPDLLDKKVAADLKKVNQAIQLREKQDSLGDVQEKIVAVDKSLTNLQIVNSLYKDIDDWKVTLHETNEELNELEPLITDSTKRDTVIKQALTVVGNIRDILSGLSEKEARLKSYKDQVSAYQTHREELSRLQEEFSQLKPQEEALQTNLSGTRADLDQLNKDYYLITDSTDRLNKIHAVRTYYKLIQDSLDPKKGIPLIFTRNYLTSISERANELLDVAYKGTYQIRFILDKRDFRIEVLKGDGNNLEDITLASQGETSMTSISLSLSMLGQIMGDTGGYNVLYLDEMDAELDANNRKSFINVIDRQMEILGVEQTFIITHNNEFHSSDIDLILLDGYETKIDITDPLVMEGKAVIYQNY